MIRQATFCRDLTLRHLNYGHLMYFWVVAREGSIARASEILHITPQTISGQLKLLDESVGERLFDRSGRNLVLSSTGRLVFHYADEIFSVGAELADVVRGNRESVPRFLIVGIVETIPKLVASSLLTPVLRGTEVPVLHCEEASLDQLLGELAVHKLDLVISDQPLPSGLHIRAYNHPLGDSGVSFFCRRSDWQKYKGPFPENIDRAPILLPTRDNVLRRRLDEWFHAQQIYPRIVGEINDSALLKAFGQAGAGIFPAPTAIEEDISKMYGVRPIGRTDEVKERFFAISPEQRLKHPSVVSIIESARKNLFN